jgi:hypothetical protein
VTGLAIEHLRLCPNCYLVTWTDAQGMHMRQGVPLKKGSDPLENLTPGINWSTGEPEKC